MEWSHSKQAQTVLCKCRLLRMQHNNGQNNMKIFDVHFVKSQKKFEITIQFVEFLSKTKKEMFWAITLLIVVAVFGQQNTQEIFTKSQLRQSHEAFAKRAFRDWSLSLVEGELANVKRNVIRKAVMGDTSLSFHILCGEIRGQNPVDTFNGYGLRSMFESIRVDNVPSITIFQLLCNPELTDHILDKLKHMFPDSTFSQTEPPCMKPELLEAFQAKPIRDGDCVTYTIAW